MRNTCARVWQVLVRGEYERWSTNTLAGDLDSRDAGGQTRKGPTLHVLYFLGSRTKYCSYRGARRRLRWHVGVPRRIGPGDGALGGLHHRHFGVGYDPPGVIL